MFDKSMNYSTKHDFWGAFLFFLTHLVFLTGLSTVLVYFFGMAGMIETTGTFFEGSEVHTLIGSLFVLWLGGTILTKRDMTSDVMSVAMVLIGVYLAWTTSAILGLVPIALMTTFGKK